MAKNSAANQLLALGCFSDLPGSATCCSRLGKDVTEAGAYKTVTAVGGENNMGKGPGGEVTQ